MDSSAVSRLSTALARTVLLWLCVALLFSILLVGMLHAQTADGPQVLHNGTTTNSTGVQQKVRGMLAVSLQVVVAGGWDGTLHWETSQDESAYVAVPCRDATAGTASTTATAAGRYLCNIAGAERFQARIAGRTVGSATVVAQFSGVVPTGNFGEGMLTETDPLTDVNLEQIAGDPVVTGGVAGSLGVGGLVAAGDPVAGHPVQVGGIDGAGDLQAVLTDTSGRVEVNPISGQAGITGGAGSVAANTPRATLASDDPAVVALQILDDWDESDRAKVNPIVGQAGVQGGSGGVSATTQRVVLATDVALPTGTNTLGVVSTNSTGTVLADTTSNTVQIPTNGAAAVSQRMFPHLFNGASWDRWRSGSATSTDPHYGAAKVQEVGGQITLQASQVAATTNGTTTRTTTTGLGGFRDLDILLNITNGGAVTGTLQIFLQDSADGGTTWDDVVSSNLFVFGAAVTTQRFILSGRIASTITQGSAVSVEALAAGTVRNGPFGDRLRVREVVSGVAGGPTGPTYTITAVVK